MNNGDNERRPCWLLHDNNNKKNCNMMIKQTSGARRDIQSVDKLDPIWIRVRREAEALIAAEPSLAGFVLASVLNQTGFEQAVTHRIAARLGHATMSGDLIAQTFDQTRQLRLVAPAVLRQIALRRAGVPFKIAQHFAVHMGDGVRPVAQEAVLQRAVGVHDGMHELQRVVLRGRFHANPIWLTLSSDCATIDDIINHQNANRNECKP